MQSNRITDHRRATATRPMRRAIGILIKYLISPRDLRTRVTHSRHNERCSLAAGSLFKVWRVRSLKFALSKEVRGRGEYFPASLWKQTNFHRGFLYPFMSPTYRSIPSWSLRVAWNYPKQFLRLHAFGT